MCPGERKFSPYNASPRSFSIAKCDFEPATNNNGHGDSASEIMTFTFRRVSVITRGGSSSGVYTWAVEQKRKKRDRGRGECELINCFLFANSTKREPGL